MSHVATVTIDHLEVSADLTDFVVLVDLSDLPSAFWDVVANGGGDIRCYKGDGTTQLARDVVSCDTATDTGELHVKYSGVLSSSVDTEIQIHADGTSSEPAVTDTYGRNAVWSDYVAVYHLSDTPTGSAGDIVDSAGNYDGDSSSMGAGNAVSGLFGAGGALDFDGSADHVRLGLWSEVGGGTAISVQFWSSPDALNDSGAIISGDWNDSTVTDRSFMVSNYGTDEMQWVTTDQSASNYDIRRSTNANLSTAGVYSFVATWDTSDGKIYKDGSLLTGTWSGGSVTALGSTASYGVILGSRYSGSVAYPFNGTIDEVRARMSVLSADWIATEYANQSAPASFYAATAAGGGGVSLTVQSANHGHIADAPTLVQAHAMTPAEASHAHGVESPTLTQANALSPEETVHGHSAESPALSAAGTLEPADAVHAHSAESPTILQAHVLVVLDSAHAHTADNVTLTLGGSLDVADALHGHVVDQPTLTQANAIAPADSSHGHAAESPAMTQDNSMSPADATHGHAADQPTLDLSVYLSPSEAMHAHAADAPTITQANILAVDEALHAHYADSPLLPQDYTIVVSDTLHAHLTASPNLILGTLPLMSGRVYLSRATLRVYRPTKRLNS